MQAWWDNGFVSVVPFKLHVIANARLTAPRIGGLEQLYLASYAHYRHTKSVAFILRLAAFGS